MRGHHFWRKGFTIVELIIVVMVIAIIASIILVGYGAVQREARDKAVMADVDNVESEIVRYGTANSGVYGSAVQWYSPNGANPNLNFTPSNGNVLDIVATNKEYCIRGYNPQSATYSSISSAYSKGADKASCVSIFPSVAAGGSGGRVIGLYRLNGTTIDDSDSARTGVAYNVTPTTDKNGNANSAYAFDGTSSYISLGTSPDYDYSTFSVSVWAQAVGTPPHVTTLIGKGSWNTANDWFMGFKSGTAASFVYGLANWNVGPSYPFTAYDPTQWTNYVATVTPTQEKLYINGVLQSTVTASHVSVANTYDMQIGRASYVANYFKGNIDDVRLYNVALDDPTVAKLYSLGPE